MLRIALPEGAPRTVSMVSTTDPTGERMRRFFDLMDAAREARELGLSTRPVRWDPDE